MRKNIVEDIAMKDLERMTNEELYIVLVVIEKEEDNGNSI